MIADRLLEFIRENKDRPFFAYYPTVIPHLALQGTKLTCPKHEWQFDITTGECIAKGDRPLRHWKSKLENGRLLAYW